MELGNMIFGNSRGMYEVERFPAQDFFGNFFDIVGLDAYGHPSKESPLFAYTNEEGMIDTELFSIFPYYWVEDKELMKVPNFVFKPNGTEIKWYKYPLRDSYSNTELSSESIKDMLGKCV